MMEKYIFEINDMLTESFLMVQHIRCDSYGDHRACKVPAHTKTAKYPFWLEQRCGNVRQRYSSISISVLVFPGAKESERSAVMRQDWTLTRWMHVPLLFIAASDEGTCLLTLSQVPPSRCPLTEPLSYIHSAAKGTCYEASFWNKPNSE